MRSISLRVDVGDLGHVVELHQAVGGEDLVGRRLAEPGEAAAGDFEGEQALVAVGDVALGLGVDLGRELLRALHVVEREDVGVGAGGGLFEAAAGHAQDAVHAFDDLAERAGIEADENAAGIGDGGPQGSRDRGAAAVLDSRRPLKTRFCSRPLGMTSISRTTMSSVAAPSCARRG